MDPLLLLILADVLVTTVVGATTEKARQLLIAKWKEGSLSETELSGLKRSKWFQQHYSKPLLPAVLEKKYD